MAKHSYLISVRTDTELLSAQKALQLGDELRQLTGVEEVSRQKTESASMDLGSIVQILATSASTLAIARGIGDWIRRNRGTHLKIERNENSGSIKAEIQNYDPEIAKAITEVILNK